MPCGKQRALGCFCPTSHQCWFLPPKMRLSYRVKGNPGIRQCGGSQILQGDFVTCHDRPENHPAFEAECSGVHGGVPASIPPSPWIGEKGDGVKEEVFRRREWWAKASRHSGRLSSSPGFLFCSCPFILFQCRESEDWKQCW